MKFWAPMLLGLVAAPLHAAEPPNIHLFGERVGSGSENARVGKRLDNRLRSRVQTRIEPRTALDPLRIVKAPALAVPNDGCGVAGVSATPCRPR